MAISAVVAKCSHFCLSKQTPFSRMTRRIYYLYREEYWLVGGQFNPSKRPTITYKRFLFVAVDVTNIRSVGNKHIPL